MIKGLMWVDNDPKRGLRQKVELLAKRYMEKHMQVPTICYVHPSMMEHGMEAVGKIKIVPYSGLLTWNMWIGIEEKE